MSGSRPAPRLADARVESPDGGLIARGAGTFTVNRAHRSARDARADGRT